MAGEIFKMKSFPKKSVCKESLFYSANFCTLLHEKRKTLINALANSNKYGAKEQIEQALTKLKIDTKIRPEKLTLEQFSELSKIV